MCTVTFIPLRANDYVLTSNRDEAPTRISLPPQINHISGLSVLFPKDTGANGTWVATSEKGRTLCLLNGAFEKHKRELPYSKSRGVILLENFNYASVDYWANVIDLFRVEPFTMVIVERSDIVELFEFRWDGVRKHFKKLDSSENHVWSSATLYNDQYVEKRKSWFQDWMRQNKGEKEDVAKQFHQEGGDLSDVEHCIKMKRGEKVQTVSTTQIIAHKSQVSMEHINYVTEETSFEEIYLT